MKGYKSLLEQCSLLEVSSLKTMKEQKISLNKLFQSLQKAEDQVCRNVKNIKSCLITVQSNAINFLQQLNWQLDLFLSDFRESEDYFACGCGFTTQDKEEFVNHTIQLHKCWKSPRQSSHFVSKFGNAFPSDIKNAIFLQKKLFNNSESQQHCNKTKLRNKKSSQNIERIIQQKKTKSHNSKDESQKESQLVTGEYYCGQCQKYILNHRFFSHHMKTHDYIIHPDSSHIIIRRKNKPAETIQTKDNQRPHEIYVCSCNPHKNFTHTDFVAHVFKWHKGITPRV